MSSNHFDRLYTDIDDVQKNEGGAAGAGALLLAAGPWSVAIHREGVSEESGSSSCLRNKMFVLFLNGLDPAAHGLKAPDAGKWFNDGSGYNFLESYGRSIRIEGDIKDIRKVHSVPSAFARPILFSQALGANSADNDVASQAQLVEPVTQGGTRTVARTDGIVRIEGDFGFDLVLEEFKVPGKDDLARMRKLAGSGTRDLKFLTILREQMPKPKSIWEQCWIIRCEGKLIGATSPWTVVYTPAEYTCPASIPWRDANTGLLTDPLTYLAAKNGKAGDHCFGAMGRTGIGLTPGQ